MKKVSIVKCNSYDSGQVRRALKQSLKNISASFKPNMTILIKPNLLSPMPPKKAITTHPNIIKELCKILKKYNAKIYIGDSSAHETEKALEICGINKLSKYAKILNFEGEPKKFFDLGNKELNRIPLPKILFKVDLVINLAKLKTHSLTKVTLCTKNLYGCIPGQLKEKYHRVLPDPKHFSNLLVKIHETIKPELNIIDGVIGIEGEGPGASGKPKKAKLIIASKNAYAADIITSEIMGFKPNTIYTNKYSKLKRKNIETVGNGKNIKLNFQKPKSSDIAFLLWLGKILPKPKIAFNYDKCIKCGICKRKCPVNAIKLCPYLKCNHKKCIKCLCCIEVCPKDAIYLEEPFLRKILTKLSRFLRKV